MEKMRSPCLPLAVRAVAIAAGALWYGRRPPEEPPAVAQAPSEPAKPEDAPLPPPAKSDPQLRKDLGSLSSLPEWAQWLGVSDLLDRFVVIVDNVAEDVNPRKQLDFVKVAPQKTEKLDSARYGRIADGIGSID